MHGTTAAERLSPGVSRTTAFGVTASLAGHAAAGGAIYCHANPDVLDGVKKAFQQGVDATREQLAGLIETNVPVTTDRVMEAMGRVAENHVQKAAEWQDTLGGSAAKVASWVQENGGTAYEALFNNVGSVDPQTAAMGAGALALGSVAVGGRDLLNEGEVADRLRELGRMAQETIQNFVSALKESLSPAIAGSEATPRDQLSAAFGHLETWTGYFKPGESAQKPLYSFTAGDLTFAGRGGPDPRGNRVFAQNDLATSSGDRTFEAFTCFADGRQMAITVDRTDPSKSICCLYEADGTPAWDQAMTADGTRYLGSPKTREETLCNLLGTYQYRQTELLARAADIENREAPSTHRVELHLDRMRITVRDPNGKLDNPSGPAVVDAGEDGLWNINLEAGRPVETPRDLRDCEPEIPEAGSGMRMR